MTKKHFVAMAAIVKRMVHSGDLNQRADAEAIAAAFALIAVQSNSRFDLKRFRSACGL